MQDITCETIFHLKIQWETRVAKLIFGFMRFLDISHVMETHGRYMWIRDVAYEISHLHAKTWISHICFLYSLHGNVYWSNLKQKTRHLTVQVIQPLSFSEIALRYLEGNRTHLSICVSLATVTVTKSVNELVHLKNSMFFIMIHISFDPGWNT